MGKFFSKTIVLKNFFWATTAFFIGAFLTGAEYSKWGNTLDEGCLKIGDEFVVNKYKKLKVHYLFSGDDYQLLFTASKKNRSLIKSIGKKMNQKFTIIGKINNGYKKNLLKLDNKPQNLSKFKGYSHKF